MKSTLARPRTSSTTLGNTAWFVWMTNSLLLQHFPSAAPEETLRAESVYFCVSSVYLLNRYFPTHFLRYLLSLIFFCHFLSFLYYFLPSPPPFFQLHFSSLHPFLSISFYFVAFRPTSPLPFSSLSVLLSPLLPRSLLCAPDLLSLCLITKSTGSSRRSCRRSSPSVRSSLTSGQRYILAWRSVCVCACGLLNSQPAHICT